MAYGLHYSDTLLGRVFSQCTTPLGLTPPLYTTTAICASGIAALPVLNPLGSNRNVELVQVDFAWASTATTTAAGSAFYLMGVPCGAGAATGAPVAAFASTVPVNGLLGAGGASKCLSQAGAGTVSLTAAGTTLPPSSTAAGAVRVLASVDAQTTGTPTTTSISSFKFDGTIIIPPGFMVYVAGTITANIGLYGMTMVWKEIPIVPNAG